jgi:hypothetical protein
VTQPITNSEVAAVFEAYPPKIRRKLLALRELILDVAASTEGVGEVEETLKWGEPAYLTSATKSGATIRIDWKPRAPAQYAMYLHCQTDLVANFRAMFSETLEFEGNRSIVLDEEAELPVEPLSFCIAAALRYHLDKKERQAGAR